MIDTLIDPVRTLRGFAQSTVMAPTLRDAIEDVCSETESLRIEAYEALRREQDTEELTIRHTEYRVHGILRDGTAWYSPTQRGSAGEGHCISLLELLTDGRMEWQLEPQIESRQVMETPWTTA